MLRPPLRMNSEEEFYDAETGEREILHVLTHPCLLYLWGNELCANSPHSVLSPSGLESDDSCEVSFKDAVVFGSKQVTDGSRTQENGVWERR